MRKIIIGQNDQAWEKLFRKYDILQKIKDNETFEISSKQINEFREARLMTKFDFKKSLPTLFKDNNISILPISRGQYLISHFDNYKDIDIFDNNDVTKMNFPDYIKSIDFNNISSESTALNCAHVSGILSDFIGEKKLYPTVNGRMGSDSFSFNITNTNSKNKIEVSVNNSQLEIDAGFETRNALTLIEAKNSLSENFIIRQIYYPFRLWSDRIKKELISIYMTYSNGFYRLYQFEFIDPSDYNSINLVKQKIYQIETKNISIDTVKSLIEDIKIISEPYIPFPQANSFNRIINLCELLYENDELTKEEITSNYDFDARQTDYYTNAGIYLGLIEKKVEEGQISYCLNKFGYSFFALNLTERQLQFIKIILEHYAFNETFKFYLRKGKMPSYKEIVEIMKRANLYKIDSESTFFRRASTVISWLYWIINIINKS